METTDTWAAFGSEYIKAIDVLNDTDEYVIVSVSSKLEDGKDTLHLDIERDGFKKLFGCNKTNTYAVQQECPKSPKDCIGRKITFNKVQAQKPGTSPIEYVDGLRIKFVEEIKEIEEVKEEIKQPTEVIDVPEESLM